MKKLGRKITLGIAGLLAIGCVAVGGKALDGGANIFARAEDNATMTVDTLGNLEWAETSGATGYNWNYTIGGTTSATYFAEDNEVNVGIALTKAAQAAIAVNNADTDTTNDVAASVQFSVTPVLETGVGAEMIYTHTFTQYIDYGYATHDFADVKAQAEKPTKLSELVLETGAANLWTSSAMFKNDVLTIGMRTDVALHANGISFGLFGPYLNGDGHWNQYNYAIMLQQTGRIALRVRGGLNEYYASTPAGTEYNTPLVLGEDYYLSMAVFDTYDLTGAVVGDTVYYSRSVFDADENDLTEVGGWSLFIDNATLTEKGVTYKKTSTLYSKTNADGSITKTDEIEVDISALLIKAYGKTDSGIERNNLVYVFSGIPACDGLEAPTGIYYDNADATINWNAVKGASAYEWKVGDGAWTKTNVRKISVEAYFTEYKTIGYLPISVRAVGGKSTTYHLDLNKFYNARSTVVDFLDLAKVSSNKINLPENVTDRYYPGGKKFPTTGITFGKHVTFCFDVLAENGNRDKIFSYMGLLGGTKDALRLNRYFLVILGDGTLLLGNYANTWATTSSSSYEKSDWWNVTNFTDGLVRGSTYYVTYGIDEIYENDVKVAERITVRIEVEEDDGLTRRTIAFVTVDNTRFVADGTLMEYTDTAEFFGENNYVYLRQALDETNVCDVDFTVNDETLKTEKATYGKYYDFTAVMDEQLEIPQGYRMDGWVYDYNGRTYDFAFSGNWNVPVNESLTVRANLIPIEYNVSFGDAETDNETVYTIESDETLKPAVSKEVNKVFDGWYEKTDTEFQNPITTLGGMTGDLELVARFVDGFTITIINGNGTEKKSYKNGDSPISLVADTVEHKEFVKWQKVYDGEYYDYEGSLTFVPTSSATYAAEYKWKEYSITYVADSATYSNPMKYTVNAPVTLSNATKAGYVFVGWYADSEYTTKVTDTETYAENLTLYARFVENNLPNRLDMDRSKTLVALPTPNLENGALCEVKLSLNNEELTIQNGAYVFDKAGIYDLEYRITLSDGEVITHKLSVNVAGVYVVNVHYGNGQVQTLRKQVGEKLSTEDLPDTANGYEYDGLYVDSDFENEYDLNAVLSDDVNVYVKWIPIKQSQKGNLAFGLLGAVGGVVIGGVVTSIFIFRLKKKEDM